ncbi:MAG: GNAT family N-acetyltransferase [Bacteroidota bacterium]
MDVTLLTAATDQHFEGILQLQKENLYKTLPVEQQTREGFVYAEHNLEVLKRMASYLPQVIALAGGKVVGYNLAMTSVMQNELSSLAPMFEEFKKCHYRGRPLADYHFIVGGQVCVDKDFRGQGLLSRLYRGTAERVSSQYQLCVTEISQRNSKSLAAHLKMGFEVIRTYDDKSELWDIVAWNMR